MKDPGKLWTTVSRLKDCPESNRVVKQLREAQKCSLLVRTIEDWKKLPQCVFTAVSSVEAFELKLLNLFPGA